MASFTCSWIPSFPLLTHPLYEVALEPSHEPLLAPITKPFLKFLHVILQALALHLLDWTHPFYLQVTEKERHALRVLSHHWYITWHPLNIYQKKNQNILSKYGQLVCVLWVYWTSYTWRKMVNLPFSPPFPSPKIQGSLNSTTFQSFLSSGSIDSGCSLIFQLYPWSSFQLADLTLLRYIWIICFCWFLPPTIFSSKF